MSSSIYQGLQSCLEPRLVETRVLRLKLTPSKSNSFRPIAEDLNLSVSHFDSQIQPHMEMGENNAAAAAAVAAERTTTNSGWNFLQADSTKKDHESNEKTVYVHPLMKKSFTTLSEKSLELCTESLGSESGSEMCIDEIMSLFSSSSSDDDDEEKRTRLSKMRELRASKKLSKQSRTSFPPPLTSISIKVKSHREGGRLVLKAVPFPPVKPCFQVERGGGRLTLRLLKHCFSDNKEEEMGEVEEEEEVVSGEKEEKCETEGETEEDIEVNNENVGGEMGIGKHPRPSRCKEGGQGSKALLNWEPVLVST